MGRVHDACATGKEADNWAALGHAYMTVLGHAIKAASPNPTREKIRDALARTKNVPVVAGSGSYNIDERRMPNYGAAFLQVKGGKFEAAAQYPLSAIQMKRPG